MKKQVAKKANSRDEKIQRALEGASKTYSVLKIILLTVGCLISLALLSGLIYAVVTVVKGLKEFIV